MKKFRVDEASETDRRILILPATVRDGEALADILTSFEVSCVVCSSLAGLLREMDVGTGVLLLAEEWLNGNYDALVDRLTNQPVWSDVPVILISRAGVEDLSLTNALPRLGNVTVLERPVRVTTMVSVIRSCLRARDRQYQVCRQFAEQRRIESALRFSREQLEVVVKGANVGIWYCPLPFDRLIWDDKVKEHFHMESEAEVTIELFYSRLHPADRERTRKLIEKSIETREPYEIDYRTVSEDGTSMRWIHASGRGFYDVEGAPIRFDGITIDITERVNAEEELRESEERLRLAVQTGKLGIWELDLLTWEMRSSEICRENYGRSPEEELTYQDILDAIHPDDVVMLKTALEDSLQGQGECEVEYRNIWPDGSVHWILARGRVLFSEDDQPMVMIGVCLDISERKYVEERRAAILDAERAARNEAERTGQMKDEFLATLSHELRTPLNAILGWAQILKRNLGNTRNVEQGIDVIDRNARVQAKIIEDLLDMSRIISGKIRLEIQTVNILDSVSAAIETVESAAHAKEIQIVRDLSVADSLLSADPGRLQQIFWNLLSNAVKFTPKGGTIKVSIRRVESSIEVGVTDSGQGIDPGFLGQVFDRFRQADASITRRHGGLGLGLAIVKQLAELHGGTVSVRSDGEGKGSVFTVKLPCASVVPQSGEDISESRVLNTPQPHSGNPTDICGISLLIVDDEPDARGLLVRLLEGSGAEVVSAASSTEALSILDSYRPDVLISDIGMPDEDGYTMMRKIRNRAPEKGGDVPAIALTAYARESDAKLAIGAGFQRHVTKPANAIDVITAVSELTRDHVRVRKAG